MTKFHATIFWRGKNSTDISLKRQNQVIEVIVTTFQQYVVDEIKQAHFFARQAYETTNTLKSAQLSMCLGYIC